jgi:hypothetical protein
MFAWITSLFISNFMFETCFSHVTNEPYFGHGYLCFSMFSYEAASTKMSDFCPRNLLPQDVVLRVVTPYSDVAG